MGYTLCPSPGYPADKTRNPPLCGTVVDRGITQGRTLNFYLRSHTTLQGTAMPDRYTVLEHEVSRHHPNRADEIQKITHSICYLFRRATTAISICPPAYLADLACTRARSYLADRLPPPLTDQEKKQKEVQEKERIKRQMKETKEETEARKAKENAGENDRQTTVLKSQQDRIEIHGNVKDTMFYI